jgi:sorbitol/mannitol transport system permease protein
LVSRRSWETIRLSAIVCLLTSSLGWGAINWFADLPLLAIIIIVSWEWLPFALLILLTAMLSEQLI